MCRALETDYLTITNSIVDAAQRLSLIYGLLELQEHEDILPINGTPTADAVICIRDSLLHTAILAVLRVYDRQSDNNTTFIKVFDQIEQDTQSLRQQYSEIKNSENFTECQRIRHGRIAHLLNDTGRTRDFLRCIFLLQQETLTLINQTSALIGKEGIPQEQLNFYRDMSRDFWSTVMRGVANASN